MLTAFISYENIEGVDWDGGRDYDQFPHIYCHFNLKGWPYEKLAYSDRRTLDEIVYFIPIANYKDVQKQSRRHARRVFLRQIGRQLGLGRDVSMGS